MYEVARRLVSRGVEVTVLTTDRHRSFRREESLEGIRVCRVAAWPRQRDYYFAPAVVRAITNSQADVMHLHSHHTFVAPMAMAAAGRRGLPFVVTFHGIGHRSSVRGPLRPLQVSVLRPLLAHAKRLIALNEGERELFQSLLRFSPERFVVIPNGGDRLVIEDEEISPVADRPNPHLIVSVGRLERFKGHHRLVAALPLIRERYPDVRLAIVGEGPEHDALMSLAAQLGVADSIGIGGIALTDRLAMAKQVRRANVVALLSEGEGQPLTMLEAAALARPLVVTDAPGLRELIDKGMALGVPLHASSRQIADAIVMQLDQPLIPNRAAVPTWAQCVDALVDIYGAAAGLSGSTSDAHRRSSYD